MSGLSLLNVLDVARALGPDPLRTTPIHVADWLMGYVKKRGGSFNYNTSISTTFDLFRGVSTYDDAVRHCSMSGNPKGRRQNTDAIKQVAPYALENVSSCYRIGFVAVAVGRTRGETVYIGIKTPMVRVAHHEAFVVMPGFRMSHRPVEAEIDVACSIIGNLRAGRLRRRRLRVSLCRPRGFWPT